MLRRPLFLLRWLPMLLGLWELSSPYALHYRSGPHTESALVLGALIALAGFWAAGLHERLAYLFTALGAFLLLVLPFTQPGGHAVNDLLVGAAILLVSLIAVVPHVMRP